MRWLNRDPAGYVDSMNLYGYGAGNPVFGLDPYGLWNLLKWVYTGDGNASDEEYYAAKNGAADYYTANAGETHEALRAISKVDKTGLSRLVDKALTELEGPILHAAVMAAPPQPATNVGQQATGFVRQYGPWIIGIAYALEMLRQFAQSSPGAPGDDSAPNSDLDYPDGGSPPAHGWEQRGPRGNWYNEDTGETLSPDNHPPFGPHYDYQRRGCPERWRFFPDRRWERK